MVSSAMLGGLQPIVLTKARHERTSRAWWEAGRLCAMRSFVQPGDLVIDVGAEAGDFSALYALWGARVVCVEPNWLAWPSIKAHFEANEVRPHACFEGFAADTSSDKWMMVNYDYPNAAQGEYTAAHDFRTLAEYDEIQRLTIDKMAEDQFVRHLCIDVEGAEGRVLAGATRVLSNDRPMVWLSLHPDEWLAVYGDSEASIRQLADDAGYTWVPISQDPHETHCLWVPNERFWGW